MKSLSPALASLLLIALVSARRAQAQAPMGTTAPTSTPGANTEAHPQLAFRSFGWSMPFGRTGNDEGKLSELVAGTFPTILDLGMRWNRWLLVGVYLGFNYGVPSKTISDGCAEAVRCSVSSFRFGGQLQFYPSTSGTYRPWFGIGAGYESLSVLIDIPTTTGTDSRGLGVTLRGVELANLLFGVDYHVNDTFAFGPYLGLGLGAYTSASLDVVNGQYQTEKTDPALHAWGTAGIRLTLFP